jgi:hypothetical protein
VKGVADREAALADGEAFSGSSNFDEQIKHRLKGNAQLRDGECRNLPCLKSVGRSQEVEVLYSRIMAPSVASLYCAEEDVSGAGAWDSYEEERRRESTGGIQRLTTIHFQPVVLLDFPVDDEDAIAMLMKKEACYMPEAEYWGRYRSRLLNAGARQNAIRWMLKVFSFFLSFFLSSQH